MVNGNRLIFDAGSGIIKLGAEILNEYFGNGGKGLIKLTLFITHMHHDHTQGLPFFKPAYLGTTQLFIFGPKMNGVDIYDHLRIIFKAPHFPVEIDELLSHKISQNIDEAHVVVFNDKASNPELRNFYLEEVPADEDAVRVWVNRNYAHPKNGVFNYKIEYKGKTVVLATDVEGYIMDDVKLINFSKGADLLIHDAQYKDNTYTSAPVPKQGFGHSTPKMAARVAAKADVKKLILFHHDPDHDDSSIREIARTARRIFSNTDPAFEGMEIDLFEENLSDKAKK
jgi:ribonuclease BN (tRNA processing enzyme)